MDIESIRKAAQLIASSFDWSSTTQGCKYWRDVRDNLLGLADQFREPTLEDIGKEVEVRDHKNGEWEKMTLYGVAPSNGGPKQYRFFGTCSEGYSDYHKMARIGVGNDDEK